MNSDKGNDLYLRGEIRTLKPYSVEEESFRVKLDANENPFDLPAEVKEEVLSAARSKPFNRYPDANATVLREMVAQDLNLKKENILFGNGSDELIQLILATYGAPGRRAVFPAPTFEMYNVLTQVSGMVPVSVALDKRNFDLDEKEFLKELAKEKTELCFLVYPNSPTGNCFSTAKVEEVLKASRGLVVIDEAYFQFCGKTFVPRLKTYPNLIVLRTFSKAFGLAGLRAGYCVGTPEVLANLWKVKLPYNLNALTQLAVQGAMRYKKKVLEKVEEILRERDKLADRLAHVPGVKPYPSETNFIFFEVEKGASRVFEQLKKEGILIRSFQDQPGLDGFMRVTGGV